MSKPNFFTRLKFAWYAFRMKPVEFFYPYRYHCQLRKDFDTDCDNSRRKSKCTNKATVALADPTFQIRFTEANHFYHVCDQCAEKYTGTMLGETDA